MQLKWGSYSFLENGCGIASATRIVTAPGTGRPIRYATRATIDGWVEGDTQASLSSLEAALRTALLKPYQDLKFLTDGGAATPLTMNDRDSITGVRVLNFSFPGDNGAEYATIRKFTADVEAEFVIAGTENAVISFRESLSFTGTGGPNTRVRTPVNTPVQIRQVVTPASPVRAVQSGSAVGHMARPTPPPPLWPDFELGPQRQIGADSPERFGPRAGALGNFQVSWTYFFEADQPLRGDPATPPA